MVELIVINPGRESKNIVSRSGFKVRFISASERSNSKYALYKNTLNRNTKILIMVLWPQIEITELYKKNLKKNNLEKDIQDVLQQDILKNIKEY